MDHARSLVNKMLRDKVMVMVKELFFAVLPRGETCEL